jgi:hypothetical protein
LVIEIGLQNTFNTSAEVGNDDDAGVFESLVVGIGDAGAEELVDVASGEGFGAVGGGLGEEGLAAAGQKAVRGEVDDEELAGDVEEWRDAALPFGDSEDGCRGNRGGAVGGGRPGGRRSQGGRGTEDAGHDQGPPAG